MNIIPFKVEHTYCPYLSAMSPNIKALPQETWGIVEASGLAFSGEVRGKIVGFAGLSTIHPGVADAWSFLTPEALHYRFSMHKAVKRGMETLVDEHGFHRIQCSVKADFQAGAIWAERLGFFLEGPLFAWGPDKKDYNRYVRLFCEHPMNN